MSKSTHSNLSIRQFTQIHSQTTLRRNNFPSILWIRYERDKDRPGITPISLVVLLLASACCRQNCKRNIRINGVPCQNMDRIQMAEYWDQWNSTVNMILHPEVPKLYGISRSLDSEEDFFA